MAAESSTALTVALTSTQRLWHGGEEQLRLLAVGLRRRGSRCVLFGRRGSHILDRMESDGFETIAVPGRGRSPITLWKLRRQLERLRPDVLHHNDSNAMTSVGLAALGLPIPARIAARRVDFPLHSPRAYRWLSDRVVCVSNAVAQVCRDGGIPDAMLRVVFDGVDPARGAEGNRWRGRQSLELADNETLLLVIATLTHHKGHRYLIDAMPEVLSRRPNVVLALAGDGDLHDALWRQAERLGVLANVRFLGYRTDVPDLIHAADLFVMPSQTEGLCSTLIDVMLAGRPIVTTTAGGIPDLVGRDESGNGPVALLVPPRDPPALAAAILQVLDSPDSFTAMCEAARRRAFDRFTADLMVDATIKVYREVLASA